MENRRQNYRHVFPVDEALPVALQLAAGSPFWNGVALDLSVTGTRVRLYPGARHLAIDDRVTLRFIFPGSNMRLDMHGVVVHCASDDGGETYGIEFLPSLNPSADERREHVIWQFLLAEQRRAIQRLHGQTQA